MTEWNITTTEPDTAIRAFLQEQSPWRTLIRFNERISTEEFPTFQPFNRRPLQKVLTAAKHLPESILSGRVLDVGYNYGYNSIYLAATYGADVVGIEINTEHQQKAARLAQMSGVSPEFLTGHAETFVRERAFDLVLHFGTLYHLPNPFLALETAVRNLRLDGWLALETTAYIGSGNGNDALWFNGFHGDTSNFWALGKGTIEGMLDVLGFVDIRCIAEVSPAAYQGKMSRVMYVARKNPSEDQQEQMALQGLGDFHGRPGTILFPERHAARKLAAATKKTD